MSTALITISDVGSFYRNALRFMDEAEIAELIPTISETQAMMAPNGGRLARRGGAEYSTYSATSQRGQRFARQVRAPVGSLNVGMKWFLAREPEAGVLMKGTGGIRKRRWSASGRGTRGGCEGHLLRSR